MSEREDEIDDTIGACGGERSELAALRQQLAEAAVESRVLATNLILKKEIVGLKQQLAEARADQGNRMNYEQATRRMMECATEWHLFPDSFPVRQEIEKCLTALLAAQAAELERLREENERLKANPIVRKVAAEPFQIEDDCD